MQIKKLLYILVLLHVVATSSYAQQDSISVKYPTGRVFMEYDLISIAMYVPPGSADLIKASVNDKEVVSIVPDMKYECFSVPLKLGVNRIDITALKGENETFKTALDVFRRSDLVGDFIKVPNDFHKEYFHSGPTQECAECHILEPREYDMKPISPASFTAEAFDKKTVLEATSTCYSCHYKIASAPYVHGPVAVWSCLSCHESGSDPRYSVKKPDADVCFGCHVEQKEDWGSKKVTHGPVTLGKCTICHSPHSAQYPFNLYMARWNLCVNCHEEKGTGRHVLGDSFSTEGHPTRNKPDPIRIGKELSCSSCHQPHASNVPHLWAFEVKDMFELCTKCHSDKSK